MFWNYWDLAPFSNNSMTKVYTDYVSQSAVSVCPKAAGKDLGQGTLFCTTTDIEIHYYSQLHGVVSCFQCADLRTDHCDIVLFCFVFIL